MILLTGANGQIGWELARRGTARGLDILAFNHRSLDITDKAAVRQAIARSKVSLVINAAAYTAVDQAESDLPAAYRVNRDGPACLAAACAEAGIPLMHISTDYVFDGLKRTPYLETDPMAPTGVYGRSKAEGEAEVRSRLTEHIILRTSWVYGIHGNNFVKTMLRLGAEKDVIRVVDDQFGCPTFAADIADALLDMVQSITKKELAAWGTYHFAGRGVTTWYDFAVKIFELVKTHQTLSVRKIEPIPSSAYPTPAKRPAYSVLDCSAIERTFGVTPRPWQESLARMLEEI